MTEPLLSAWESFYVIVGSAAAGLTGLQFVVITLGAERGLGSTATTASFATPTVVHFSTVLLIASLLSAPWHETMWPLVIVGLCGAAGCVYLSRVIRVARGQRDYRPVFEDVVWHWWLPGAAYSGLTLCGFFYAHPEQTLFAVAGGSMLLLFIGIHNAWDSVVFIAERRRGAGTGDDPAAFQDTGD